MDFLPSVIRAKYDGGFRISLTFNDNLQGTVDFQGWLQGPVFEPLKDRNYFQRFFIEGGTIAWPNGADIAPETLYEAVKSLPAAHRRVGNRRRRSSGAPRSRTGAPDTGSGGR